MKKILSCTILVLVAQGAFAGNSLGGKYKETTTATQGYSAKVLASSTNTQNYKTYTQTDTSGVIITQYVNNDGTVFAISWSGETLPNLSELLGKYFENYIDPNNKKATNLHTNSIENGDLIVKNGGHVRAFKGIAYLKSQVPENFFNLNSF